MGNPWPASFWFIFIFSNKHYNFYKIICEKFQSKISIQYMVLGFEPKTLRIWVFSHNHWTRWGLIASPNRNKSNGFSSGSENAMITLDWRTHGHVPSWCLIKKKSLLLCSFCWRRIFLHYFLLRLCHCFCSFVCCLFD